VAINRLNPDYPDAGLVQLVPSSIAVGSGSGSINGNGSVSFSGASSVSVNDCFSSTYNNYKILIDVDATDADAGLSARMRVSGADNSSSNYRWSSGYVPMTTTSTIAGQNGSGLGTSFRWFAVSSSGRSISSIDLFNPFTAEETQYVGNYQQIASNQYAQFVAGNTSVTTSYTGFTIFPTAGTITGNITIYGYRN